MQGVADQLGSIDLQAFGIVLGKLLEFGDRLLDRQVLRAIAGKGIDWQRSVRFGQGRQGIGNTRDITGAGGTVRPAHFQQSCAGYEAPASVHGWLCLCLCRSGRQIDQHQCQSGNLTHWSLSATAADDAANSIVHRPGTAKGAQDKLVKSKALAEAAGVARLVLDAL